MPQRQLTGARIRSRRLDRQISQSDLAARVGISASYLNLIEHNRRRIGGKILNDIARELELEVAVLADGAERGLVEALRAAAASQAQAGAETDQSEDFAARFPGWSGLVVGQARRLAALEERVAAMSDRLTHDPHLDTALHEVLSVVTAIRSTASILVGSDGLDPDWQGRFHRNIHGDSRRLADASQALAAYLDAPKDEGGAAFSPVEELERFLDLNGYHVASLEGPEPMLTPRAIVDGAAGLSAGGRDLALAWLGQYRADVLAVPLDQLAQAALDHDHDPAAIAEALEVPLVTVLRRLAALPVGGAHPEIGLAVCDGAGALLHLKPIEGFALPRTGPGCPLWPLYQALSRPGQPMRAVVTMPGASSPRLTCYAIAEAQGPVSFDTPPVYAATMLVVADAPVTPARPVGRTCRICPQPACTARREPSILPEPSVAPIGGP